MTFDRLEYEKAHLGMDRFFLFLRDFELTSAQIDGKKTEVVDKNDLVLIFKKVSSNCKDVSFEEFITLLQKIGVLYFDQK